MNGKMMLAIILFAGFPILSFAQHPILAAFSARQIDENIQLDWTILGGNTCNGTFIYRQNKEGVFEQIGAIEGICGDSDVNEQYTFQDSMPLSGVNHYTLQLGLQGYTDTIFAFFVQPGIHGVKAIYTPTETQLHLQEEWMDARIKLLASNGRLLYKGNAHSPIVQLNELTAQHGILWVLLEKGHKRKSLQVLLR